MQSFGVLIGRAFLYVLFIVGVAQLITLEGYSQLSESTYNEVSLTEKMQDLFGFLSCVFFLVAARMSTELRPIAVMLAALTGMMFIRESDSFLDHNVFDGAWQALVSVVIVATIVFLKKQTQPIKPSIVEYARLPSAGVLLSGILVTFVFSRLFGRRSFWEAVMGDNYVRVVKNIVEEGTELMGYALILIAAIELVLHVFVKNKREQA